MLGLHELSFAMGSLPPQMIKSSSTVPVSSNINNSNASQAIYATTLGRYNNTSTAASSSTTSSIDGDLHTATATLSATVTPTLTSTTNQALSSTNTKTTSISSSTSPIKCNTISNSSSSTTGTSTFIHQNTFKGWYIQPACAITGDGLQEGLEALYDMIIKKRKLNKAHKKRR